MNGCHHHNEHISALNHVIVFEIAWSIFALPSNSTMPTHLFFLRGSNPQWFEWEGSRWQTNTTEIFRSCCLSLSHKNSSHHHAKAQTCEIGGRENLFIRIRPLFQVSRWCTGKYRKHRLKFKKNSTGWNLWNLNTLPIFKMRQQHPHPRTKSFAAKLSSIALFNARMNLRMMVLNGSDLQSAGFREIPLGTSWYSRYPSRCEVHSKLSC